MRNVLVVAVDVLFAATVGTIRLFEPEVGIAPAKAATRLGVVPLMEVSKCLAGQGLACRVCTQPTAEGVAHGLVDRVGLVPVLRMVRSIAGTSDGVELHDKDFVNRRGRVAIGLLVVEKLRKTHRRQVDRDRMVVNGHVVWCARGAE